MEDGDDIKDILGNKFYPDEEEEVEDYDDEEDDNGKEDIARVKAKVKK